jgi:iron(III) transport system substrate-binding protein
MSANMESEALRSRTETITRRRFISLASLAGLALAACGGAASTAAPSSGAPSSAAPAPASPKPAASAAASAKPAASAAASAKPAASAAAKPSGAASPAASSASVAPVPQSLIDAAKKEGPITYYSSTIPSSSERIAAAFKDHYGIEVQYTRLASTQLAQRYSAEADAGNVVADVVQISDPLFFQQAVSKNWLAKVADADLPSLATYPKDSWNGMYAKAHTGPLTLSWNTSVVKPEDTPKGWEDVLKPVFKGQILLVDLRNAPILWSWGLLVMQTYGEDYLRKLGEQQPRLVASSVPGSQELAAGAAALLVPGTHSDTLELKKSNAPVNDIYPSPTVGNESYVGVSAKAPHPNGGKLLLNYIISPEGQSIYVKDGYASVVPNLPGAEPLPAGYQGPKPQEALAASQKMLDLLGIH